jgi:hypothetical protein
MARAGLDRFIPLNPFADRMRRPWHAATMQRSARRFTLVIVFSLPLTAAALVRAGEKSDPLAAEIERLDSFIRKNRSNDELWPDVKKSTEPALARTRAALDAGRRWLALQRLASVAVNLDGSAYLQQRTINQRTEAADFEKEWTRIGEVLQKELAPIPPESLQGIAPAAVRAVGETALFQVRPFYESSLDYGRSTMPDAGLFYLGSAQAARDLAEKSRALSVPSKEAPPPLRSLAPEIDALEAELLATYRPPVSIERHSEFIGASSMLNDARKLDAAGLRYGALLRYLQAALRTATLKASPAADLSALRARLPEMTRRLDARGVDHTVGRIFLEAAEEDLASAPSAPPGGGGAPPPPGVTTAVVFEDVLPGYFSALEPARPLAARPPAEVTVTLVRWPFT